MYPVAEVIGETIGGRYDVLSLIGEGGMGSVFEARHTGTARRVALKVITRRGADNEELLDRFRVEAKAAGVIESDHIAQVFDFGMDEERGTPFLAMELLEGETLSELVTRLGPLPDDVAVRIVTQAARGLTKAHETGVLHRDIKPANIFVAKKDRGRRLVKMLDFGIARLRGDVAEGAKITTTGTLMGSPLYMSPEQTNGLKKVDARSDVFSLGVVMFEALAGRAPHSDTDGIGSLIIKLCTEQVPLRDQVPDASAAVAGVVDRALRLAPDDRFQTMRDMLHALEAIAEDDTLTESVLRSRSAVAERGSETGADQASPLGPDPGADAGPDPEAAHAGAETTRGVTTTTDLPRVSTTLWPWALVAAGVVGIAGYVFFGGDASNPAAPSPETTVDPVPTTKETSPVATSEPTSTAAAALTIEPTASASASVPLPPPRVVPAPPPSVVAAPPPPPLEPPPPPPSHGFETEM